MKLLREEITKKTEFAILGHESWLKPWYELFGPSNSEVRLTGQIVVEPIVDFVRVQGQISFIPVLNCSRCADGIPWAIERKFDVTFQDDPHVDEERGERALVRSELDHYYFQDDSIDILSVINDFVHEAIPTRILKTDDGERCTICLTDLGDNQVYSSAPEGCSPFAILGSLNKH